MATETPLSAKDVALLEQAALCRELSQQWAAAQAEAERLRLEYRAASEAVDALVETRKRAHHDAVSRLEGLATGRWFNPSSCQWEEYTDAR
jgi:hypothetical protein